MSSITSSTKKNIQHITVESYLRKKKERPTMREKTSLRYFKFDTKEKTFSYKDRKENPEIKVIHIGKDLKGFEDRVDDRDKSFSEWMYGFKVVTSIKTYILFAENEEIYFKWKRGLSFYFNGITGITNPIQESNNNHLYNPNTFNEYTPGRSYSNNKIAKPNIFSNNNLDFDNDFDNDDLNLINNIMSQNKKIEKNIHNSNDVHNNNKNTNNYNYSTKDNKVKISEELEHKPRSTSQIVVHTPTQALSQNPTYSSKRLTKEDRKKLLEEEMSKNKLTGKMMTEFVVNNVKNKIPFNENELQPKYKLKEKKKEPTEPKIVIKGIDDNGDYNGYNLNWYDYKNHDSNNLNLIKENFMVKSNKYYNTKGDFGTLKQELDKEGFYGRINNDKNDFYTPSPIAAQNNKGKNLFENFELDDLENQQLINPIFLPENPNVSYQRVPFHTKTKSESNIIQSNQLNQVKIKGELDDVNLNRKFTFNQNYDQIKTLNMIKSSSLINNGDDKAFQELSQNQINSDLHNKNQIQQQGKESTINLKGKSPVQVNVPTDNWTDINDDWGMNKKTNLDALLQKSNQNLYLQPRQIPKQKLEKNLFDEGTLHIKKSSAASKKVSIENLHFGGGKHQEPFFSLNEEKEKISKSPTPVRRANKKVQSQNESNLELEVSRTIILDEGEEVNVKRKILGTGDAMNRTFVMNLVVPEQLAKFSENRTDERIKQITDQYLNKTGHAVYTGRQRVNVGDQTTNDLNLSKNMSVNITNVNNTSQIDGNLNPTGNLTQYINQEQMMMGNPGYDVNPNSTINQTTVIEMIMKVPDKKAVMRDLKSKQSILGEHVHEVVQGDEFHTRIQHTYKIESMTYLGDDFHMPVSEIKELPKKEDSNKSKITDKENPLENENSEKLSDVNQLNSQVNNLNISNFYNEQNLGGNNMMEGPNFNNHNESINDISHISRQYSHLNIEEVWDASVIIDDDFDFEIK